MENQLEQKVLEPKPEPYSRIGKIDWICDLMCEECLFFSLFDYALVFLVAESTLLTVIQEACKADGKLTATIKQFETVQFNMNAIKSEISRIQSLLGALYDKQDELQVCLFALSFF